SNWDAERKSSEFSNLKFDVSWAPAVSLAKGIYPSVPIPVFKGNFMLRISVLVFAVLFLIGCGGGSLPFIPPHSGTSGGTGSSNGSSGGATSNSGSSGSGTSSSGSSGSGTSSSGSSGGSGSSGSRGNTRRHGSL